MQTDAMQLQPTAVQEESSLLVELDAAHPEGREISINHALVIDDLACQHVEVSMIDIPTLRFLDPEVGCKRNGTARRNCLSIHYGRNGAARWVENGAAELDAGGAGRLALNLRSYYYLCS